MFVFGVSGYWQLPLRLIRRLRMGMGENKKALITKRLFIGFQ